MPEPYLALITPLTGRRRRACRPIPRKVCRAYLRAIPTRDCQDKAADRPRIRSTIRHSRIRACPLVVSRSDLIRACTNAADAAAVASQVIVAVHRAGQEWEVKAYRSDRRKDRRRPRRAATPLI